MAKSTSGSMSGLDAGQGIPALLNRVGHDTIPLEIEMGVIAERVVGEP
jgi:hypothetical protein